MKNHLKTYTFILKTLSPVFIGSGKELTKKEYIYMPNGHRVIIPDFHKFSNFLIKKNLLEEYTDFMTGWEKDLYKWLCNRGIRTEEIELFKHYELSAGDAIIPGKPLRGVHLFVKDSHGDPYVPGSSLKGALRTAILAAMIYDNATLRQKYIRILENELNNYKATLSEGAQEIEYELLHTLNFKPDKKKDAVNSVLKGIHVSDSLPIDRKNLIICAKVDVTKEGKTCSLPTYRECIKPGTEITFGITLDEDILKSAGIDINFIMSSIRKFSEIQHKYFISRFTLPGNKDVSIADKGLELFLGGGAGFVSKTIVYSSGGERGINFTGRILNKQFFKHNHVKDISYGVSPRMIKCTKYERKIYLFGRCECRVIE